MPVIISRMLEYTGYSKQDRYRSRTVIAVVRNIQREIAPVRRKMQRAEGKVNHAPIVRGRSRRIARPENLQTMAP